MLVVDRDHSPYALGGGGRATLYLEKFSNRFGLDLTIIANRPVLKVSKEVKDNIAIYRVPAIGSTFLTRLPSFGYFASSLVSKIQKDYDLIYSNSPIFCKIDCPFIANFQGTRYGEYLACKRAGKYIHAFLNRAYIPFDKIMLEKAEGAIVLSQNMIEEINAMGGVKKDVAVIPNGVDTNLFKPLKPHNFDSQEKKVLYVGRLDLRKGIDMLFYSFAKLTKKVKAKLIIVGEGEEKKKLFSLSKTLGIPVEFKGRISNIELPQIYNEADLFVLPSLYEPFGMVALEAMACGTPTLVSNAVPVDGIPKFVVGDVNGLSNLLLETLSSESKLRELSQTCFEIAQKYNWERIIFKIVEFFKKFT